MYGLTSSKAVCRLVCQVVACSHTLSQLVFTVTSRSVRALALLSSVQCSDKWDPLNKTYIKYTLKKCQSLDIWFYLKLVNIVWVTVSQNLRLKTGNRKLGSVKYYPILSYSHPRTKLLIKSLKYYFHYRSILIYFLFIHPSFLVGFRSCISWGKFQIPLKNIYSGF